MASSVTCALPNVAVASGRSEHRNRPTARSHAICVVPRTSCSIALRVASPKGLVTLKQNRLRRVIPRNSTITMGAATVKEEVIVTVRRPLGMVLAEQVGTGSVFVEELVTGGNAELSGEIQVGDVILACGVSADAMIEGSNFDEVMDALGSSPQSPEMVLRLSRLCAAPPPPPASTVEAMVDQVTQLTLEPESVLRNALLDNKVDLYTNWGKMSNCGGGGSCGTCVVQVLEGMDQLSAKSEAELKLLRKKPSDYRLACQTVCEGRGSGTLRLQTKPK